MAWVTGPHSDAPEGTICWPTEEHGVVTWFEPDVVEPPPPPPPADEGAR